MSILLPVFGAWVGAIIAFYYGNKNFEKLSAANDRMIEKYSSAIDESVTLGSLKVEEILTEFPDYKKVLHAKISDEIGKSFKNIGNTFLLKDDADKPLGFIYKEDILAYVNFDEKDLKTKSDLFKDFKANQITDEITGKIWTELGLQNETKNYAEVNLSDTLLQVQLKMKALNKSQKVRGLVLNTQKQIVGIITYDLFSLVITTRSKPNVAS